MPTGPQRALRRWARLRQAGAERERALRRTAPPSTDEAIARGFGLIDFAAAILGWPLPEDKVSQRQAEATYRTWRRLRRRLASR